MYHMIEDIECVEEENNSKLVIDDYLSIEKQKTLDITRTSETEYDAITIPGTDIDPTKSVGEEDELSQCSDESGENSMNKVKNNSVNQFYLEILIIPLLKYCNIPIFEK